MLDFDECVDLIKQLNIQLDKHTARQLFQVGPGWEAVCAGQGDMFVQGSACGERVCCGRWVMHSWGYRIGDWSSICRVGDKFRSG